MSKNVAESSPRRARRDTFLRGAIARGVFPAATAEIGDRRGALSWSTALGARCHPPSARFPATGDDTIFDLASLTKPLAVTNLTLAPHF